MSAFVFAFEQGIGLEESSSICRQSGHHRDTVLECNLDTTDTVLECHYKGNIKRRISL